VARARLDNSSHVLLHRGPLNHTNNHVTKGTVDWKMTVSLTVVLHDEGIAVHGGVEQGGLHSVPNDDVKNKENEKKLMYTGKEVR
jgi:hypothetical protein